MRYQNLRYGNPVELQYFVQGRSIKDVARQLRRSERSVKDWLEGKKKLPWWVPEIIRLQHGEHMENLRQMGMVGHRSRLGLVSASVIAFPTRPLIQDEPA